MRDESRFEIIDEGTWVGVFGPIPKYGLFLAGPGIYIADGTLPDPVRVNMVSLRDDDEMREFVQHVIEGPVPPGGIFVEDMGFYITGTGQFLNRTHDEAPECTERGCCVHAPSDHHLRNLDTFWRGDRGLMERLCKHGIGHPDPDHMAWYASCHGEESTEAEAVHGCDGCCSPEAAEGDSSQPSE